MTVPPTLPLDMEAALFHAPGDVRVQSVSIPAVGPGEVLMRINAALTCGTDLKCFRRGHPVLLKTFPSPFGHECSGTLVYLGEGVHGFQVGDRVVCANSAPCGTCFYCAKGQENLCESLDLLNGAYAQYLKVPAQIVARNMYKVPDHVSDQAAAFVEPLSIALRGILDAGVKPGDRVAILGLGAIGQLMVRVAHWHGAHVTALGRNPFRRSIAKTFGHADEVLDLREFSSDGDLVAQATPEGRGFDVVIEVVGKAETWEQALRLVRRGGTVNWYGGCPSGSTVTLDTRRIHYDEIKILSLFHHTPHYIEMALNCIADGSLDPTPLISRQVGLNEVVQALEWVEAGEVVKVAILPNP